VIEVSHSRVLNPFAYKRVNLHVWEISEKYSNLTHPERVKFTRSASMYQLSDILESLIG
jgi:hypothetical protein